MGMFGKVVWELLFVIFEIHIGEKYVKIRIMLFKMWKYEFEIDD